MTTNRTLGAIVISTILICSGICAAAPSTPPETEATQPAVPIMRWLMAGPAGFPLPVFADATTGGVKVAALLDQTMLPSARVRPAEGDPVAWFEDQPLNWKSVKTGKAGLLRLRRPKAAEMPAVVWLAAYLRVDRFGTFDLELAGDYPRRVWLDGEPLASGGSGDEGESVQGKLELTTGDHIILVKTVFDPARESDWTITATLSGEQADGVRMTIAPRRDLEILDVLDPPTIGSIAVSPDGSRIATTVTRVVPGTDESEAWVEIRAAGDGALSETWRGSAKVRQIAWSPDGRFISYVAAAAGGDDDASTLFLYDVARRTANPLLESIAHFAGYTWTPTGKTIVYSTTREAEEDERGVKRLGGLLDRWAGYRDKEFLHLATVPGGSRRLLTAGELSTNAADISPDGGRLLFTRRVEDLTERPFTRTQLWEMDLRTFQARQLREFRWLNNASYGPRGERILVLAAADEFGDVGVDLAGDEIPNGYDGQLFIWNPATDEIRTITRDFDPAVSQAVWSKYDGHVYLTAEQRDYHPLFRFDTGRDSFEQLDTGFDVNRRLTLAHDAATIVVLATSPWVAERLVALDSSSGAARTLEHPAGDWFAAVETGTVEPWTFLASNGKTIDGRIYFPPRFDPKQSYPAIVYYYGGTSPVGREFGGRYPKEWWAANGYVVYVLQPSGATGFGQQFSADHVNDWGKTTTEEIVEGTRRFLDAHPFVDAKRVGCIGASYGGFMTMLLSTQTDVFAAAVSHAGISSLSSYWGEGYWGFLYSAVATAGSYPWNREDIYVDQSPLFRADQTRVPILLTHGVADTNVPVGESDAFYIALKLLGKDVEYLQFAGQNHWIVDHAKRIVWSRSIVAWFDRMLKDQPQWWNALYPDSASLEERPTVSGEPFAR